MRWQRLVNSRHERPFEGRSMFLDRYKVSTKLWAIISVAALGYLVLMFSAVRDLRNQAEDAHKELVRAANQVAFTAIKHFHGLEVAGKLTREQAQEQARASVTAIRYGQDDYFFVFDHDVRLLVHGGKAELVGKSLKGQADSAGAQVFDDMVNLARSKGSGFVSLMFPKPGGSKPLPKVNYVSAFEPWGWVLGSGVYLDDIDAAIRADMIEYAIETAIIIALVIGLALLVRRSILRQLGGEPAYAAGILRQVAAGDLTTRVEVVGGKDSLLGSLETALGNLRALIGGVGENSKNVGRATQEIATAAEEVSVASHRQSDATSSMAAAIEQMTVSINHISESATETRADSQKAADLAVEGEQRVGAAVTKMGVIASAVSAASDKVQALVTRVDAVGQVAGVIKEIASQTNLLALNAAIEAARAGELGRGFAVVADEVRKLAERTSSATVEIEQMIHAIQTEAQIAVEAMEQAGPEVEGGVQLAQVAAASLRQIAEGAQATMARISEVANATREQSAASNSIAQQVEQFAQMVEETGAAMGETSSSVKDLRSLAERLDAAVAQFRY
jgi:methyl-accepting chemotaxis protein